MMTFHLYLIDDVIVKLIIYMSYYELINNLLKINL